MFDRIWELDADGDVDIRYDVCGIEEGGSPVAYLYRKSWRLDVWCLDCRSGYLDSKVTVDDK